MRRSPPEVPLVRCLRQCTDSRASEPAVPVLVSTESISNLKTGTGIPQEKQVGLVPGRHSKVNVSDVSHENVFVSQCT